MPKVHSVFALLIISSCSTTPLETYNNLYPDKAMAVAIYDKGSYVKTGGYGLAVGTSIADAKEKAIKTCKQYNPNHVCVLEMVNDNYVYSDSLATLRLSRSIIEFGKEVSNLDYKIKRVLDKPYDAAFYNLKFFNKDFNNIKSRIEIGNSEIRTIESNVKRNNALATRNTVSLESFVVSFNELSLLIPELKAKELNFINLEKEEDKKIKKAVEIVTKQKKIEKEKKLAKEARNELVIATKKILFNLGYEVDIRNNNYDLKAKTALIAFQKDYDINPINNEPSENLLSELQRAFRNSPNPLDLSNYFVSGSGSGFVVNDEGFVVTNVHVVEGCSLITAGKKIPASIEKADIVNDVAILKINNNGNYTPLKISENDIELGEEIFVAGFPINMILENLNFTSGTISSEVGVGQNINQFQFTAPIQPGNSGGPVFNSYGGVVGIAVSTASTKKFEEMIGTNIQNINFGIKASTIKSLLKQSDVSLSIGNPNWFTGQKNVASVAKTGTVLIQCWKEEE